MKFCCDKFKEAYQNNIVPIVEVPTTLNIYVKKELCVFCGRQYKEQK